MHDGIEVPLAMRPTFSEPASALCFLEVLTKTQAKLE